MATANPPSSPGSYQRRSLAGSAQRSDGADDQQHGGSGQQQIQAGQAACAARASTLKMSSTALPGSRAPSTWL